VTAAGILLLTPSRGRGGGIERYVETLEWAFAAQGIEGRRIDLDGSGPAAHARMLAQCRLQLRNSKGPTRLIVVHRALLPVASLLSRERSVCGISVVCHGTEVWGDRFRARWLAENCLMRRPSIRVVAVSGFTAGALVGNGPVTVLPPGLSRGWFDTLVEASAAARAGEPGIHLVTAFRLADWRNKGLPELLSAVFALGRPDVHVSVCGSGRPPPELQRLIRHHSCCTLRAGLTDGELARQLAAADLFVLATRTRRGRHPSGEGFGLVLLESQVAGTPVVGPASGGSHDAYIERVTGVSPADETTGSLTKILDQLLKDPILLAQMGGRAAAWARECFAPERYASLAVARLL
jgi:phosphatidyl-myo-inositol dimannoside synthase